MEELKERGFDSEATLETVRQARQGDEAACEAIYRTHCRRVYSLCLRMVRNPSEAEDLAQDAFLLVFRKIGTFRGESAFSSWLHRVTTNVVLMHLRRKKAALAHLEYTLPDEEGADGRRMELGVTDRRINSVVERESLETALKELPEGCKDMLLLHDVDGYCHKEIAKLCGCTVGNSKSQLCRARKRMRQLLERRAPQKLSIANAEVATMLR